MLAIVEENAGSSELHPGLRSSVALPSRYTPCDGTISIDPPDQLPRRGPWSGADHRARHEFGSKYLRARPPSCSGRHGRVRSWMPVRILPLTPRTILGGAAPQYLHSCSEDLPVLRNVSGASLGHCDRIARLAGLGRPFVCGVDLASSAAPRQGERALIAAPALRPRNCAPRPLIRVP